MEEEMVTAPVTPKQPSRKGKRAWRKNVDISEVQTGIEAVREQELSGGVVAEKAADALFALDPAGDEKIQETHFKGKKLLKADEILAQRSAVPALDQRKRKAEDVVLGSSKKRANGTYVSHKELRRLRSAAGNAAAVALEEPDAAHDPWADNRKPKDPRLSFLDDEKPIKEPKTLKHAPSTLSATGKTMPSVPKPQAGKSYNPAFEDWSALLEREGAKAVEEEKKRLAAEAAELERQGKAEAEAALVDAQDKDEYATDYESAWESEWEGIQSGAEEQWMPKQSRRKTPAERNKVKARKEREAQAQHGRKTKARAAQEQRIKQIAQEIAAKDLIKPSITNSLVVTAAVDSDADEDDTVELQRRRFGKVAIPDAPLELVLPDELQDSLRRLRPEGNMLNDRYRSLLVSGKVEARKPIQQAKLYKREVMEKWTYKDWKLK